MSLSCLFIRSGRTTGSRDLLLDKSEGSDNSLHHSMEPRAWFGIKNGLPEIAERPSDGNGAEGSFRVENNTTKTYSSKCFQAVKY